AFEDPERRNPTIKRTFRGLGTSQSGNKKAFEARNAAIRHKKAFEALERRNPAIKRLSKTRNAAIRQ
ncbi:hypothetical protein HMPREF9140_00149, partial [Prevotella micans F0438]